MDSELTTRISGVVQELARQEQKRLRAAGTFIELEDLACQIGDEVTRQLLQTELVDRSNEASEESSDYCPNCGGGCSGAEPVERTLDSSRGRVAYVEPAFYCQSCRRSFFPGSRNDGVASPLDCDSQAGSANGLGGD